MPLIQYEVHNFKPSTMATIEHAQAIVETYRQQGYTLTLRQLYYQMVSRDLIRNTQKEYSRLGDVVSKARRAGLIDWTAIVDRTRNLQSLPTWDSPSDIVQAISEQFRYDRWAKQPTYVEVWFEKDALMGVFERVANRFRVPFFSCRGYTSDSEVWGAAQRLKAMARGQNWTNGPKDIVILHFGDHDPSGIDMTRDIGDRLRLFGAKRVDIRRLALNMDQIDQYQPPPNPAKETDSRFQSYLANYGDESWELDALEPAVLAALVETELGTIIERTAWDDEVERELTARGELGAISQHYEEASEWVVDTYGLADVPDDEDEDEDGEEEPE
jgi:hypothetical protein